MMSWLVGSVILLVVAAAGWSKWSSFPRQRDRRGRELLSERDAAAASKHSNGQITWGGAQLPEGAETSHFLCVGTTGSGKSLTLKRLMREALGAAKLGSDVRAVVYDAKTEAPSELDSLDLDVPVVYLNPFDQRGVQWDMSADITSPVAALQVASIFIPEEEGSSNRYFTDTARDLFREVMMSFIRAGASWTLRDLVLAMRSKEALTEVLEKSPEGAELLAMHGGDARAFHNVLSTLRSRLMPFEPIAALWSRAKQKVSLRDWVAGEMVLVLGNDDSARAAMDAVNRVIFQRLVELSLKQPNSKTRRSWYFLDEVREAGKLDGLSQLLNKGRSRGCCVALGFQDIHGMKAVYGPEVALELLGQCSQKALLRLESEATAKWASATIGQYEQVDVMHGQSGSLTREGQKSASEQWRTADLVMPSELLGIPPTTMKGGLTGYYLTPHVGAFRKTLPLRELLGRGRARDGVVDLVERPESEQYLERWGVQDCIRLGLSTAVSIEPTKEEPELERRRKELAQGGAWDSFKHTPDWRTR